jgi:hypothetical protein
MFELRATHIVERDIYCKFGDEDKPERQFRRIQYWRRGSISIDERPDLSNYKEDKGINLSEVNEDWPFGDYSFEDGYQEWEFPPTMSKTARQSIIDLDMEGDLCDDGWEVLEHETWFYGPLAVSERSKD